MRDKSVLLALSIATAAVLFAVWQVVSAPSSHPAEDSVVRVEQEAPSPASSSSALQRAAFPERRNSKGEEVPARIDLATAGLDADQVQASVEGTTLLVVDFESGEPVERFAIHINRSARIQDVSHASLAKRMQTVPRGAMLVPAEIDGYHYLIQAAGYPAQIGQVAAVSPTDRRAYIRLEREVVVTGRVLFNGVPVKDAQVLMTPENKWFRKAQGGRTDETGRFTLENVHPALGQIHAYTGRRRDGEVFANHTSRHVPILGSRQYDLGDLQLSPLDGGIRSPVDPGVSTLTEIEYLNLDSEQRK